MATSTNNLVSQMTAKMAGVRRCDVSMKPCYMLDFHIYKPGQDWSVSWEELQVIGKKQFEHPEQKVRDFCYKLSDASGVRKDGSFLPPGITRAKDGETPMERTIKAAREEAEEVMFTSVRELLKDNGLTARDVDVLVVNCSLFNPTPSLAAMLINHFKMRSDIITYNLGGMGCSAGLLSISLVNELLQVHPNCRAVVVSMENITQNYYTGTNRSMFIPNALFKVGGAAILLSNRWADAKRAKYKLLHTVRTHLGAKDDAYQCVFQQEDPDGNVGVKLDKKLMLIAGEALKKNIEVLGTVALPLSEQLKYVWDKTRRGMSKKYAEKPSYVPDFKKAFKHYCIHPGGRGVLDAMQDNLALTDDMMKPSRATLNYFGNTSSSGIWYELGWMESYGRVKKGDNVWQIGFGSGFKCNSAVWKAMRNTRTLHRAWTTEQEKPLLNKSYKGAEDGSSFDGSEDAATLADQHIGNEALNSFRGSFQTNKRVKSYSDLRPAGRGNGSHGNGGSGNGHNRRDGGEEMRPLLQKKEA